MDDDIFGMVMGNELNQGPQEAAPPASVAAADKKAEEAAAFRATEAAAKKAAEAAAAAIKTAKEAAAVTAAKELAAVKAAEELAAMKAAEELASVMEAAGGDMNDDIFAMVMGNASIAADDALVHQQPQEIVPPASVAAAYNQSDKAAAVKPAEGSACPNGGAHSFRFGMCRKCRRAEGRLRSRGPKTLGEPLRAPEGCQ